MPAPVNVGAGGCAPVPASIGVAPCEAEVEDLDVAVLGDEDVLGFQIAMDDPALVSGREALSDLQSPFDGARDADFGGPQTVAQRGAFEQLHDGEHGPVDGADVVDGDEVRMRQRRNDARLLLEARERFGVRRRLRRKHLDGHVAAQARIASAIHLAHAAGAEW